VTATHSTVAELYQQVTRAAWLGLVINLILGVVKLVGGIVGNSFALIADSVNSLGDVVTTVVVLVPFESLSVQRMPSIRMGILEQKALPRPMSHC
jgi:Co/Zn/Cd efflux system component